jgi:predicted Rossmann-fold nucleotide-binding protein
MLVGILGPSKLDKSGVLEAAAEHVATFLAKRKFSIIVSPAKGSTIECVVRLAKKKHVHVVGIEFQNDKDNGYPGLSRELYDESIDVISWENQPKELVTRADMFIVLGYSPGVLWEMGITKVYPMPERKIIVLLDVVKEKLPEKINKDLNIMYVNSEDIETVL